MIRTTCAWVLLLLAASPVTAPFSTCDLRLFTAHTASVQPAVARFASISATESDGGDAYSVSPLTRSVLPADSPSSVAVFPVRIPAPAAASSVRGRRNLNRSPHEPTASPTVLRL
jgi:hypothetical protein